MSAGDIKTFLGTKVTLTADLGALASSAAGVGWASASVDNSALKFPAALVTCKIETGTLPTAGAIVQVFLLQESSAGVRVDNWAGTNAALTVKNAPLLGTLVSDGTTGQVMIKQFDTAPLGPLGSKWGLLFVNTTGKDLDATDANHVIEADPYFPQIEQ